jgi:hypothetical protein
MRVVLGLRQNRKTKVDKIKQAEIVDTIQKERTGKDNENKRLIYEYF